MNNYEEQYYRVFEVPFRETYLHLKASLDTGRRRYSFTKLDFGDGPIFFINADKGEMPFIVSDFILHGFFPVVSKKIADKLMSLNINNFQLFPAVLIDDDEQWHEEFFFFNAYENLDCIDFKRSEILDYSPDDSRHEVIQYKFKNEVLDSIQLENRLIIRPEKVAGGGLLIHEKIVNKIINYVNENEFKFFKLSEYKLGDEYKL
ncbi:imm11 family protein [Photobacterium nomapromontoriensis]|uniref:imm11 family protein n=1 Tax=Photobacterium nomapromontoriensis TaxID=2910237 RepID=UPI003D0CF85A